VLPESLKLEDGGTVEEYFRELKSRQQQQQQQQSQQGQGQGQGQQGQGQPQEGEGSADSPPPGTAPGTKKPSCGGCSGNSKKSDELEQKAKEQGAEVPEGRSEVEKESIRQRTAIAIKKHVEGRGSAPGGLVRWAESKMKPPKVDWRKHLRSMVAGSMSRTRGQTDFSNTRMRKRGGMLLPTMFATVPRVSMVIDTSGSMGDGDLQTALSEAKGIFSILQQAGASEVTIAACDTKATEPKRFKSWNQKSIAELLVGGGGTDMAVGLQAAGKTKAHITVVATDGDTGWPRTKPEGVGKVVICLTRPCNYPTPSWATVVKAYDKD
jgi:predicted metal-dependent peptidase